MNAGKLMRVQTRANRRWFVLAVLIVALTVGAEAQITWTWAGDGTANNLTTPSNWLGTGTVSFVSSTELVFGDSGSYSPTPLLSSGACQIGSLTITKNGTGSIFAGNGNTSIASDGLNIATAINFSPSGTSSTTSSNPIQTTGPVYLNGLNVTIGGSASSPNYTLELGRAPASAGGGASIISSNGNPIIKTGAFELEIGGNASGLGTINLNGGSVYLDPYAIGFQSNVVTAAGTTFGIHPGPGATYTYNGGISGNGGFTMNGSSATATAVLTGTSTYAGNTTVFAGRVQYGADNTLPTATAITVNSGATLDLNNYNAQVGSLAGSGTVDLSTASSTKTLTVGGSTLAAFQGVIQNSGSGATLSLVKQGSGTLVLTGANTFAGGTTVNGGVLNVVNTTGSGLGTGAVTVNSGAQLQGSGLFTGALTLNAGATVMPLPTLTAGPTTFGAGSHYIWIIADTAGTAGVNGWTQLSINGTLALTASLANPIVIQAETYSGASLGLAANFNSNTNYTWQMTTGASSLTGFSADEFTVDISAFSNTVNGVFSVSSAGDNLYLNYTAVPEPATYATLAGLAALGLAVRRRKSGAKPRQAGFDRATK